MGNLYKRYFYRLRLLRSSDVEKNPGPRASRRSCLVVFANIRSLHRNWSDLSLIATGGAVVLCSEIIVSSKHHISEFMVPCFGRPMQLLRGEVNRFRGLAVYVLDGFPAYRQRSYECKCCDVIVVGICSSSHNFNVFGVYQKTDLSDNIFDSLLTATARMQSVDKGVFSIFGDIDAHHEEWLWSSMMHGRAARDFVSSSSCEHMVTEPKH